MVARLSALRTGRIYPRIFFWYTFLLEAESTQGPWCDQKDLCQLKIPVSPPGIEPATSWFVAQYLNHCATAVPQKCGVTEEKQEAIHQDIS
jgi:hypothetical protein